MNAKKNQIVQETYDQWVTAGKPPIATFATEIGMPRNTVKRWLLEVYPKLTKINPFVVKAKSTLYDIDGNAKLTWVKESLDERLADAAIKEFIAGLVEGARGLSPAIPAPTHCNADLLAVYPQGDPHLGLLAMESETGANFDLKIAEQLMCAAIDRLVASAPDAETGLILELGDLLHSDNQTNRTPQSGHQLDVDSRWTKVMQVGLRTMVYCINRVMSKHKKVIVRLVQGTHDSHSAFALALALDAYYHNNERVKIDLSPAVFWYYDFGNTLIGCTHGDSCKSDNLPSIMAADQPVLWGASKFRYWYHGHIHHNSVKEFPGCMVESFRTLAGKDAWHAASGYRSGRSMSMIVHHKLYGEVERHTADISMLTAA